MTWNPPTNFSPVAGTIVAHFRSELPWSQLKVQGERPDIMPKRLVTVGEIGGPQSAGTALSDILVNAWADSAADAWQIASDTLTAARSLPGVDDIKAVSGPVGPREVDDDPAFVFGGIPLTHFYVTFTVLVKGH